LVKNITPMSLEQKAQIILQREQETPSRPVCRTENGAEKHEALQDLNLIVF